VRILSVIESLEAGGAESVLVDLVLGLREHQHRVIHFSAANGLVADSVFIDALEKKGVPCREVHWLSLRDDGSRRDVLDGFSPDVVIFHWWGHNPLRHWIDALHGLPVERRPCFVCVLHHAGIPAPPNYDHYVLVARFQAGQVAHIAPARVRIIPNGVDLARFSATRPRRRSNSPMVVGRLSSLAPGKVPRDWVRTLISYQIAQARFVIAGDGATLPALVADAHRLNVADQFSFPGHVPRSDVPAMLATFDVFCYATSTAIDCHPLAIIEALAAGLPVVAEAKGGIAEIITHGHNGLLGESIAEVGEHLRRLRRDWQLMERLSRDAAETAKEFSLERQLQAYRALLAAVQRERTAVFSVIGTNL